MSHILPRLVGGSGFSMSKHAIDCIVQEHASDKGMRGIERTMHDILGVAILAWQYGSTSIAGFDCSLEENDGRVVGEEFARNTMRTRRLFDQGSANGPPPLMFT